MIEFLTEKKISRRSVLKVMSATAAVAALPGCGGGNGAKSYLDETANLTPPDITGKTVLGSAGHNCGGGCVNKFYIENGVVKRITGHEDIVDGDIFEGKAQNRGCARCLAKVDWWYRSDRLTKPLKQTKNRGDMSGFVEISWDQALTEIAEKMKSLYKTYGGKTFYNILASGDYPCQNNAITDLVNLLGPDAGSIHGTSDLSYPHHIHSYHFIDYNYEGFTRNVTTLSLMYRAGNWRGDALNADNLVLWSCNSFEARTGSKTAWYATQLREKGKKVTVIDPRYTNTAEAVADDFIGVCAGTDPALMLGMMYYMIVNTWDENGNLLANPMLDEAFIRKYVHGFFDDTNPKHYNTDIAQSAAAYQVPAGTSLSAYIMGTDNRLTKAVMSAAAAAYTNMPAGTRVNQATSVYPKTIGYNLPATDLLYGKVTPIYGQEPKTPEWAAKITGISVDKIKELATMYVRTKVHTWWSGGVQRNSEGEQAANMLPIFCAITKNFGQPGRSYGFPFDMDYGFPGMLGGKIGLNAGKKSGADYAAESYDKSKLTLHGYEFGPLAGNPARTKPCGHFMYLNGINPATWLDFVKTAGPEAGKTKFSKYNYGRSNRSKTPIKCIFQFAGNFVTQAGNSKEIVDYLTTKVGGAYPVELLAIGDLFMTPTTAIADYILPCAAPGEKWGERDSWLTADAVVMPKFIEPPGEALAEFEIARRLAAKLGVEDTFKTVDDGSGTKINSDYEWSEYNWNTKFYKMGLIDEDWDAIQKVGSADMLAERPDKIKIIAKQAFFENPAANPLGTVSGKIEAYAQAMIENYEAMNGSSIDQVTQDGDGRTTLYNNGVIFTASTVADAAKRRFVYPIPMYIPLVEGLHADGSHPDLLGRSAAGYKFRKQTRHILYRSHSTLGNVGLLNELYKRDINGERAYLNPKRKATDGPWDDNVYEPVYINPTHARELGLFEGNRVKVSSMFCSIYASVWFTNRMAPYNIGLGDSGWHTLNSQGIDVAGATNTLSSGRPSRICFGMSWSSDDRLKIEKA